MVRYATKFTPEVLIEAPRRDSAVPNPDGTMALYSLSRHTIGKDTVKELRLMDISTGKSTLLVNADKVHDAQWLGLENKIVYLRSVDDGHNLVKLADAMDPSVDHRTIGVIEAPVSALRLKVLDDETVAFVVAALVGEDGGMYNEEDENEKKKVKSSVRVYDTSRVRYVSLPVPQGISRREEG